MSIFMWPVENDRGRELLERYMRPLAQHLGERLELPQLGDDRGRMIRAIQECKAVVCDGSVEDGHIYHNFVELAKANKHVAICSRTALPRNVYSFYKCAPIHGEQLTNDVLGQWLVKVLPLILDEGFAAKGYWKRMTDTFDARRAKIAEGVGLFVSYRGRLYREACAKAKEVAARLDLPYHVVPKGAFSYETECMTRQQTWATIAAIKWAIHCAPNVMILRSEDYLDSFWTSSELLITLLFRGEIQGGILVREEDVNSGRPVPPATFGVPSPTPHLRRDYRRLLRQGDSGMVAPESRRGYRGLSGLLFRGLAHLSGHARSPDGDWWWSEVMVPCPLCGPRGRAPEDVSWAAHLRLEGYGYFPVPRSILAERHEISVPCPACRRSVNLVSRRPMRTLWVPGPLGRPWPKDMEVIENEPVWEVMP